MLVVAVEAERLPVAPIPKQSGVAFVRGDMINNASHNCQTFAESHLAKRIAGKEQGTGFAPLVAVEMTPSEFGRDKRIRWPLLCLNTGVEILRLQFRCAQS